MIRCTAPPGGFAAWDELGREFSAAVPSLAWESCRTQEGIAAGLCDDGAWPAHRAAILSCFRAARSTIDDARRSGVAVEIDVAVEPEDVEGRTCCEVGVDPELSALLGCAGVAFLVTVYPGADPTDRRA